MIYKFLRTLPRKASTIAIFTMTGLASIALLISQEFRDQGTRRVGRTISLCSINMMMTFMVTIFYPFMTELYPSRMRGTAVGCLVFYGRMVSSFSSDISDFSFNVLRINGMVVASMLSLVIVPLAFFLPETINKKKVD